MDDQREVVESLLAEKPDVEPALEELLDVDESGPWEFDDVSVDSGLFGELVSSDVVTKTDGEYRLADPDAVEAVLHGTEPEPASRTPDVDLSASLQSLDFRLLGAIALALLFVGAVRTVFMYDAVFRNGHVVLASNDPYRRLFWVERLLESELRAFDVGALANLPEPLTDDDTLMIVAVWWFAALLGGSQSAAATATAVYPVLAGVATAWLVYVLAVKVTDDRRIGLSAMLFLAITPAHAFRTALGFGDHHAFDYLLLMITAYGVVYLASQHRADWTFDRHDVVAILALGFGVAGLVHAWRGGPILIVPIALYAAFRPLMDLRAGRNTLQTTADLLVGLAIGATLSWLVHIIFGWAGFVRAITPGLVFLFVVGTTLTGAVIGRLNVTAPAKSYTLTGGVVGVLGIGLTWVLLPSFARRVDELSRYFGRTGQSNIAETTPLFGGEIGTVVGPILLFGLILFLALPYMGWAVYQNYQSDEPSWLALSVYAWYFFFLASALQIRFAAQLAMFGAIFAGLGFVHIAERIDVAEPPVPFSDPTGGESDQSTDSDWTPMVPERDTAVSLVLLFLFIGSLSFVQTPIKMNQIQTDDASYRTGAWLEDHATDESDSEPAYVFSNWGRNRFYNFMISADYSSYGYAQRNYERFVSSTDAEPWADRLRDRNAYVVTHSVQTSFSEDSLQVRLHDNLGSATGSTDGVAHLRLLYVSSDGSRKVFEPARTAAITGQADPNSTVTIETNVTVPGRSFTYERQVETDSNGWYTVKVPYSGQYQTPSGSLSVSETAIETEQAVLDDSVSVSEETTATSHYDFDLAHPNYVFDRTGRSTGIVSNATYSTDADSGEHAIEFRESNELVHVEDIPPLTEQNDSFALAFSMKGNLGNENTTYPTVFELRSEDSRLGVWARQGGSDFGGALDIGDTRYRNFGVDTTNFDEWTQFVFVYDAEGDEYRLYADGTLVSVTETEDESLPPFEELYIGSSSGRDTAPVLVDDVRLYNRALDNESVGNLYNASDSDRSENRTAPRYISHQETIRICTSRNSGSIQDICPMNHIRISALAID